MTPAQGARSLSILRALSACPTPAPSKISRSCETHRQSLEGAVMTIRNARTGGQILIDQLVAQGVERVTCVPGESYLAALDALHDSPIDVMICRAEGGAAMMAEAYGKLTGRPGICFVPRGPGATNASHGVHIAMQDSTPMILFVGQVDTGMREREAFQELDYKAVFGTMAKWAVEIDRPDRIPELVARAFRVAMQGRPGPVVISLPENMLTETAAVADAMRIEPAVSWPAPADIERVGAMLASANAAGAGGGRAAPRRYRARWCHACERQGAARHSRRLALDG